MRCYSLLLGGILILLSMVLATAPVRADSAADAKVRELIVKAFDQGLSKEEKDYLAQNHPDVAGQVPDLTNVVTESTEVIQDHLGMLGVEIAAKSRVRCSTSYGSATFKSHLGAKLYRFTQSAYICSDGKKVTRHDKPRYRVYERAVTIDDVQPRHEWVDGVGRWQSHSYVEVRVTHCIFKYGCYGASAPTGEIFVKGNGAARAKTYFSCPKIFAQQSKRKQAT